MSLTKIKTRIIQGNGLPNSLIIDAGSSLDVGTISSTPSVTVTGISYNQLAGILTVELSNGQSVNVEGFVKAKDLKKGPQGRLGRTGLSGLPGLNGFDGMKGPIGPKGFDGLKGQRGLPGPKGQQGPMGLTGYSGILGPKGQQGPTGTQGLPGIKGATGPNGKDYVLQVVVSDTDPGAIGSGSMWVKQSGFVEGDNVKFTYTNNASEITSQDIVEANTILTSGHNIPDWFYTKTLENFCYSSTYNAEYLCSTLYGAGVAIVADYESLTGKTTALIIDTPINLHTLINNPKCCIVNNEVVIIGDNTLYYNNVLTPIPLTNINSIVHNTENSILICTDTGLYSIDVVNPVLNKKFSNPCVKCIVSNTHYYISLSNNTTLAVDLQTQSEFIINGIPFYDGTILFAVCTDTSVSVYDYSNSLQYTSMITNRVKDLYVNVGDSLFVITATGLQFISINSSVEYYKPYLIEWDANTITVEVLL